MHLEIKLTDISLCVRPEPPPAVKPFAPAHHTGVTTHQAGQVQWFIFVTLQLTRVQEPLITTQFLLFKSWEEAWRTLTPPHNALAVVEKPNELQQEPDEPRPTFNSAIFSINNNSLVVLRRRWDHVDWIARAPCEQRDVLTCRSAFLHLHRNCEMKGTCTLWLKLFDSSRPRLITMWVQLIQSARVEIWSLIW